MVIRSARWTAVAVVAAGALCGSALVGAAAAPVPTDWPAYERNAAHSSAIFGDAAITTANARSLHRAWSFVADAATMAGQPNRQFDASPTVVGGRVYIGSPARVVFVLLAGARSLLCERA